MLLNKSVEWTKAQHYLLITVRTFSKTRCVSDVANILGFVLNLSKSGDSEAWNDNNTNPKDFANHYCEPEMDRLSKMHNCFIVVYYFLNLWNWDQFYDLGTFHKSL